MGAILREQGAQLSDDPAVAAAGRVEAAEQAVGPALLRE